MTLFDLIRQDGVFWTNGEIRRAINQGAVKVNGIVETDGDRDITFSDIVFIGKAIETGHIVDPGANHVCQCKRCRE